MQINWYLSGKVLVIFNSELLPVHANHRCTLRFTEPRFDFVELTFFASIPFNDLFKETKHFLLHCLPSLALQKASFSPPSLSLAGWICCASGALWTFPLGLEKRGAWCLSWEVTVALCCQNPGHYRDLKCFTWVCFDYTSPQIPLPKNVKST